MKTVSVKWFAAYREATGTESEPVSTAAGTPSELFIELKGRHPRLASSRGALVAINQEMAGWETPIQAGDEILFFPPVAGG